MPHCQPDELALAALGEPLPAESAAHLDSCECCASEVSSLRRAVDAVAAPAFAAPGSAVPPPPSVWGAIASATGVTAVPDSIAAAPGPDTARPSDEGPGATVVPLRSRRRPLLLAVAAVLAGAVVGAGAVAVVQWTGNDGESITTVALDPLPDAEASGVADVVVRSDGSRILRLELDAPVLDGSYYEIWLIDRSVEGMFPLGVVAPGTQTVELPAGVDLAEYPLVDVSVEPLDGDPTHSGVSVARGEIDA
ncbi:anti-sigma factor [Blastococcus goldschmidtiae]|uniref:Anti-sigma factor n=1 Tax=Blastococcus goldschmidtiae TaxID=3075546 RepID=A0ABU2KDB7_9ACTN|nr:anti-sigma factor [Blastococcus sp. DSM 46792]MDT0278176.1 anti-sigma factor [Blastococcus sp. DSM 46792]